jgi:hypothetical protein
MPTGAGKAKCVFRTTVAPDPISASAMETAERILSRFVALAYAADHPDLFSSKAEKPETAESSSDHTSRKDGPVLASSGVPLVARTTVAVEIAQHE